ncbi:bifunctional 4-hydroxy-2-oxoglutarate aldolase/2-dehydro-3-deoxy-phosphogluconate aldolase [Bosea caraganae]|uniref:2-dehydro-3-deoxy-phosphogluconate aldolase n=1 Tax=Bosea caraganae TaxID=2763117 RepID=A0A370L1B9_9HYPH|nr:bifunctional 4-hydroxy-2-oxoglutarate aldolase/2-dehydro-3-deoxy-phosphogluconate aldolase [Bosea caraganae]RDJ21295.1 bifunctional 4-hydroxy-2-oxoglutarate aldolase/2-dehydro-3-deoxy-phosphogluconate aldolase [Bosea caraganae]RDJ26435.1 bifunctional 4-hydroxy-2-oxoglutarate aldolase/2-dehydro-3-deoxy-phosphogluconate aldolase [Bosea caraganae]
MSHYPFKALAAGKPPLIPVIHVENADHAEPVLEALVAAGIGLVEVTLRTTAAIEVIRRMVKLGSPAIIGAGTITRPEQFDAAVDAGAKFGVGPAFSPSLFEASRKTGLPFIPGIGTASEALWAREAGFYELKLFPAEFVGGIGWFKHIEPIYPDLIFCPTAGINAANAKDFLGCPNVFAVGGGFLAPRDRIEAEDWAAVESLSRQALAAIKD